MRGINSKKLSLIDILGEIKPQLALFTETMLKSQCGFQIEGYTFIGRSREKKSSGGVGILVNDEIKDVITPHETTKDIELIWVSVRRRQKKPIFVGVYYGKQESRNNRNEMLIEMDKLSEEIQEKNNQGEIVLFMDGNAKIGLLNEPVSRNGVLLKGVFDECRLEVMNESDKCIGRVTRVNRKNSEEKSAIDFLVVSEEMEGQIQEMKIDEEGEFLPQGTAPSDHNSFQVKIAIKGINHVAREKIIRWRLNAPAEKWQDFQLKLAQASISCTEAIKKSGEIDEKYKKWKSILEGSAMETIGKTTIKPGPKARESVTIKSMREEKRQAKKSFEKSSNGPEKEVLKSKYIQKQKELRKQIEVEHIENVRTKFTAMAEKGSNGFWKEVRKNKRDVMSDWVCVKDENGQRIHDPELQKERIAQYYEELYSFDGQLERHDYHDYVKDKIREYQNDMRYEDHWYNELPCRENVSEIIKAKKNQKATTDFPNELLKRGGNFMTDCLYPVIEEFWENEVAPREWNRGTITSVYKGKGDREKLQFQRGITVSSSVSMIIEQIINERMIKLIPMTQAQGGGKKGSSTRDHVFLIRGATTYAIKSRKNLIVTFYDVAKAYDRADVDDMLVTMWEHGMKGKLWRLMKSINTNLTANIRIRNGFTRKINRIAGGKQGGKNFGFLFAKMMDVMAEDAENDEQLGIMVENLSMALLEWVDDVVTFAIGEDQQNYTLGKVDEFAIKHKLKWGREKCKVMEVGYGKYQEKSWNLGKLNIDSCTEYKYLGDWIERNGANKKNLEEREVKVMAATRKIMALCDSDVIRKIQLKALIKLHETCTLPMLLANCETWTLIEGEREKFQKIELWALKKILNVPITTPTPAIWFVTGFLLTPILIDRRQLLYLKTLIDRPTDDWPRQMLFALRKNNIGWAMQIDRKLEEYKLETIWEKIRDTPVPTWKNEVVLKTELMNKEKLIDMCTSVKGAKTKTIFVLDALKSDAYQRKQMFRIFSKNRLHARVQLMSMCGMLECSKNFKGGNAGGDCRVCGVVDDENHRINQCSRFKDCNLYQSPVKYDFHTIYSEDEDAVVRTIDVVMHIWNLENGKNEMR